MISAAPNFPHKREALLVLCEGKRDAEFISDNFNIEWKIRSIDDKKYILREIVEWNLRSPYIVVEGGKSQLEKNLSLIVRQLRSIRKGSKVIVLTLRDADTDKATVFENIFLKIKNDIESVINDRSKFSPNLKPGFSHEKLNKFTFRLLLTYKRGGLLEIFLFLIPQDLEYWINRDNFLGADWYSALNELMQNLANRSFI